MNTQDTKKSSARVSHPERRQVEMRFASLDQMLYSDHQARVVWRFVETLDVGPLYEDIEVSSTQRGRSATNPEVMLALWLLATLEGIGTARELGRRCERDIPYMWLCGGVGVNYHTLSDFRVKHGDYLEKLLIDTVTGLIHQGLVPLETIAQDGMRVRASAGTSSFRRQPTLEKIHQKATEHVERLKEEAQSESTRQQGKARREGAQDRAAREREKRVSEALETVKELQIKREKRKKGTGQEARCSTTDPQARRMKFANGGYNPGYNVQFATDGVARVIVCVDVTNEGSDGHEMLPIYEKVKEDYKQTPEHYVVDAAFATKSAVTDLEKNGTKVVAPIPRAKEAIKNGKDPHQRQANESEEFGNFRARMADQHYKDKLKMRPSQAEYPNAVCRNHGLQQFNVRGLLKTKAVALWHALAFNFQRMKTMKLIS